MPEPKSSRAERLGSELDDCSAALAESLSAGSLDRVTPVLRRFVAFVDASGCATCLVEVTPAVAGAFIRSRLESGLSPGVATMHDRRCSVRLLFRAARRLGLADGDPTLDVSLPPRAGVRVRPLADDEVALCRDVALWSLSSRRLAAVWALAEATGRGGELATVTVSDVDLERRRVWLHGGKRTGERWGELTDWGVRVLRGRLAELESDSVLVYAGAGRGIAGQVSTCSALSTILVRAGLAGEPDVRPVSVAAWAARRRFDESGDIAEVARMLGVRSLDQAARLIGWEWTQ